MQKPSAANRFVVEFSSQSIRRNRSRPTAWDEATLHEACYNSSSIPPGHDNSLPLNSVPDGIDRKLRVPRRAQRRPRIALLIEGRHAFLFAWDWQTT
jgi:hypothetical protein